MAKVIRRASEAVFVTAEEIKSTRITSDNCTILPSSNLSIYSKKGTSCSLHSLVIFCNTTLKSPVVCLGDLLLLQGGCYNLIVGEVDREGVARTALIVGDQHPP